MTQKTLRALIHIPAGLLTILGGYLGWVFAIVLFCSFMIYELNEDWHIKDQAWIDIFGYLIGLGIGIVALFILRVLEV